MYDHIEDMKQRCIMCAAGESFNHPDYTNWVNLTAT